MYDKFTRALSQVCEFRTREIVQEGSYPSMPRDPTGILMPRGLSLNRQAICHPQPKHCRSTEVCLRRSDLAQSPEQSSDDTKALQGAVNCLDADLACFARISIK